MHNSLNILSQFAFNYFLLIIGLCVFSSLIYSLPITMHYRGGLIAVQDCQE